MEITGSVDKNACRCCVPAAKLLLYVLGKPAPIAYPKEIVMRARPHRKKSTPSRFSRCPKCGKQIRIHQVRCRTCHLALKK